MEKKEPIFIIFRIYLKIIRSLELVTQRFAILTGRIALPAFVLFTAQPQHQKERRQLLGTLLLRGAKYRLSQIQIFLCINQNKYRLDFSISGRLNIFKEVLGQKRRVPLYALVLLKRSEPLNTRAESSGSKRLQLLNARLLRGIELLNAKSKLISTKFYS